MFRNLLLASAIALGTAGAAMAEGPRLVGGNANGSPTIEYDGAPGGSIVGGAQVQLSGGGSDRSYSYGQVNSFPGQIGQVIGGGAETQLVYQPVRHANGVAAAEIGAPHS